jgi:MFS family permease
MLIIAISMFVKPDASSALAVGPAGWISDRYGRMFVIRAAFLGGAIGCGVVGLGCAATSGSSSPSASR